MFDKNQVKCLNVLLDSQQFTNSCMLILYLFLFQVTQSKKQTHSGNFGKNPKDRHLSFNERKKLLYETARRKYMEKHGITDK